ncbi:MAG: hypothetical protein JHC26_10690 [Thermofilum sp.]|jgi:hypothetical protein|uniref:hypothetical protein n=1 Tax=Thermofilum sp. TaxID=1961369 RepID=UPI0025846D0B|nr:hypothetical protein [Thermofilum sp.]MCI4409548.1 hypothetical protein [Thermofilum sp.]
MKYPPQGTYVGFISTQATKTGNPAQETTSTSYVDILSIDLSTLQIPNINGIIAVKATGTFEKRSTGTGTARIAILDASNNILAYAEYTFTVNGLSLNQGISWEGLLTNARYIKLQFKTNDTDIADAYGYTTSPLALYVRIIPKITFT